MFKVLIGDYIKNIWYNLITVAIITATFIVSTIYISNIMTETRMYRLVSSYLNEDSLLMRWKMHFDDSILTNVEDSLMTKELLCYSYAIPNLRTVAIYDEEVMQYMKPRLSDGRYVRDGSSEIEVLASDSGFKVGDTVTICYMYSEKEVFVEVKVVGIIADGQKLFISSGKSGYDMNYDDLYLTYNYEQTKECVFITTQEQLDKFKTPVSYDNFCCIYKMNSGISEEERYVNQMNISDFESEYGLPTSAIVPSASKLTERMNESLNNTLLKYIPLTIGVVVLVLVCVVGIISIKVAKSMKYYAIMHICGMNSQKTVGLSGLEMFVNCFIAVLFSISLMTVQNEYGIVGTINCEIGVIHILVMFAISVTIILTTMLVTNATMKESTTMEILRDTAY